MLKEVFRKKNHLVEEDEMPTGKPLYHLRAKNGKSITVDVTLSVNPALGPNQAITEAIAFFKRKNVKKVLDFGAGALRHTLPLLKEGFQVCAVDFEEQFVNSPSKEGVPSEPRDSGVLPKLFSSCLPRDFAKTCAFLMLRCCVTPSRACQ